MGGHRGTREKGCPCLYFSTPPGVFSLGTCNTPCMCLKGNPNGTSRRKRSERKRRNREMHTSNGNVKGAMGSKGPAGPKAPPAPKPATKFCKVCHREGKSIFCSKSLPKSPFSLHKLVGKTPFLGKPPKNPAPRNPGSAPRGGGVGAPCRPADPRRPCYTKAWRGV